jgi:hypothetical protein
MREFWSESTDVSQIQHNVVDDILHIAAITLQRSRFLVTYQMDGYRIWVD